MVPRQVGLGRGVVIKTSPLISHHSDLSLLTSHATNFPNMFHPRLVCQIPVCPVSCGSLAPQALGQMSLRTLFFPSPFPNNALCHTASSAGHWQSPMSTHCGPGQCCIMIPEVDLIATRCQALCLTWSSQRPSEMAGNVPILLMRKWKLREASSKS